MGDWEDDPFVHHLGVVDEDDVVGVEYVIAFRREDVAAFESERMLDAARDAARDERAAEALGGASVIGLVGVCAAAAALATSLAAL